MKKEQFLDKVKEKFPNNLTKYDYSLLPDKVTHKNKIEIICLLHGNFKQSLGNHLYGKGCNKCGSSSSANTRRYSKEEFIQKSIEVHGNKYDYSNTSINSENGKFSITCLKHGKFWQSTSKHFSGQGCPKCGDESCANKRRSNIDDFIFKAKAVHGEKYSYLNSIYKSATDKIIITCFIHGDFEQTVNTHLGGAGCAKCNGGVRSSLEEFITRAKELHGNRYSYNKVIYVNSITKVIITCKKHGDFLQTPTEHLNYNGCIKCSFEKIALDRRHTKEEFIQKSIEVHGNKYNYDKVDYINNSTKVIITCKKHGDFLQTPGSHLQKNGCLECGIIRSNKYEFIDKANKIHNDRYDYSLVEYLDCKSKVKIICKKHGIYNQVPNSHLSGSGCPTCKESKGEKFISQTLDKYDILYEREYRISGYRYKYDFYLPEYNIYIEYHGSQHYTPSIFFGGEKTFKKQKKHDKIKIELVNRSTGLLIIIKHTVNTLEKVEEALIHLFATIHPEFLKDKVKASQEIINSNVYLISNFKIYRRKKE